ncbi:MAG: type II secretion system F family protein [Planctomycetota bacterium]|jgi:general secretion pathway protein F
MGARTNLAQAYYDLATMMDAGMPILRSIDVVIDGRQGHLKQVFKRIRETITDGSSLAEALGEHPRTFPDLDRALIEAAETSGALAMSLTTLSKWHEFVHRIIRRIQMGLIYPVLILHLGVFFAAVPDAVLNGFTPRGFIMSVIRPLLFLYIPGIVVVAFVLLRDRVPLLRWPLDVLVLRIPVLGLAVYHMSVCRYARAFGMLCGAGVPIIETTERATRATGNIVVARQFEGGNASVRAGGMVWEGFSQRLPTEYRQLWQIGEETGELDKIAGKVADLAGDRADLFFTEFSRWLPRIIYFAIMAFLAYRVLLLWGQVYGGLTTF